MKKLLLIGGAVAGLLAILLLLPSGQEAQAPVAPGSNPQAVAPAPQAALEADNTAAIDAELNGVDDGSTDSDFKDIDSDVDSL